MRPIQKLWDDYKSKVLPANAPPVQVSECQYAFYAGASALWQIILSGLSIEGEEASPEDLALMEEIQKEFEDYIKRIGGAKN